MDPNETLDEIRDLVARMNGGLYAPAMLAASAEVAEKFAALDEWMSNGGFLPRDWQDRRRR